MPFQRIAGNYSPFLAEASCDASGPETARENPSPETLDIFFSPKYIARSKAIACRIRWRDFRRIFAKCIAARSRSWRTLPLEAHPSICRLEAFGVAATLQAVNLRFGHLLPGRHLIVRCDNTVMCSWAARNSCRFGVYRLLSRQILHMELTHNCRITVKWIPTLENKIADDLTRLPSHARWLKTGRGFAEIKPVPRVVVEALAELFLSLFRGHCRFPLVRRPLLF